MLLMKLPYNNIKRSKVIIIAILLSAWTPFGILQILRADTTNKISASIVTHDEGVKGKIIADKAKIDEERNAILAADKRLQEAKKTHDKAKIEQVSKEVEQEIKTRKDTIKNIKADIRNKENGAGSFGQGSKRHRVK